MYFLKCQKMYNSLSVSVAKKVTDWPAEMAQRGKALVPKTDGLIPSLEPT